MSGSSYTTRALKSPRVCWMIGESRGLGQCLTHGSCSLNVNFLSFLFPACLWGCDLLENVGKPWALERTWELHSVVLPATVRSCPILPGCGFGTRRGHRARCHTGIVTRPAQSRSKQSRLSSSTLYFCPCSLRPHVLFLPHYHVPLLLDSGPLHTKPLFVHSFEQIPTECQVLFQDLGTQQPTEQTKVPAQMKFTF